MLFLIRNYIKEEKQSVCFIIKFTVKLHYIIRIKQYIDFNELGLVKLLSHDIRGMNNTKNNFKKSLLIVFGRLIL